MKIKSELIKNNDGDKSHHLSIPQNKNNGWIIMKQLFLYKRTEMVLFDPKRNENGPLFWFDSG